MAERVVHGLQRILRAAVGLGLAVADVGQLALDEIDHSGIGSRRRASALGERGIGRLLPLQVAQDVVQPVLDTAQIAAARIGIALDPLQQIGDPLLEMREGRGRVVADLHAVETVGQRADRAFQMFGALGGLRPLARFQRGGERGDALLQHGKAVAAVRGAIDLVDLGRQQLHVLGEPCQRFVGGDVRDDAAQGRDRAFELAHGRGVVIGAQDQIELGAEIADRLVIAGELLGRRQRAQHLLDVGKRALDAGEHLAVGAVGAGLVDATVQRADLVLDRFDRAARHRLGDGVADLGELGAEAVDRLLGIVRTLQRLDLARDLEQMAFEQREIRPRLLLVAAAEHRQAQAAPLAEHREPPRARSTVRRAAAADAVRSRRARSAVR